MKKADAMEVDEGSDTEHAEEKPKAKASARKKAITTEKKAKPPPKKKAKKVEEDSEEGEEIKMPSDLGEDLTEEDEG